MKKRLFYVLICLIHSVLAVSAQDVATTDDYPVKNSLRVGIRATGFANFSNWQTSEFIDSRYRMRPHLSTAFGVFLQEPISNRLTFEAGLSYIQLGLTSSVATNYRPGQRWGSGHNKYTMLVLPIHVLYRFSKHSSVKKYVLLGTNVYYNDGETNGQFAQSISTKVDRDTGDTLVVDERIRPVNRFGPAIVFGAGWEKRLSGKSSLSLRAVACVGLVPIVQTFLTVTAINRNRYYTSYSSTNELVNRGTYVGLEMNYLFSVR